MKSILEQIGDAKREMTESGRNPRYLYIHPDDLARVEEEVGILDAYDFFQLKIVVSDEIPSFTIYLLED